jgi:hypothetical protein
MMDEDTPTTEPEGNAGYPRGGEACEAFLQQAIEALETLPDNPNDNAKQVAIAKVKETKQFIAELL